MSSFLYRLGRACARHPFRVLALWLVAAILVVAVKNGSGGEFDNSFRVPGVESQRAADVLTERFPAQDGRTARIVFHTDDGRVDDAQHRPAVEQTLRTLATATDVAAVTDPFAAGSAAVSDDGGTAYVDVVYTVEKLTTVHHDDATAAAETSRSAGVATDFTGELARVVRAEPSSELIGVAVAIIVLLVAFGSVVAMGLPIATALMGIFVGATAVGALAGVIDVPEFALILCMMIGLGVGIDYALFVVTRHRQHLHEGMTVAEAAGTANATAGLSVVFAGTTVVIAILGLVVAGLPAITSMGVSIALVVVVSIIAAITLLPGLLGLVGTKIDRLSIHRRSRIAKPHHRTFAGRWADHVGRHPVRYAVAGFVALTAIALPALSMRIGIADDGNAAVGTTQRTAYDALADGFGTGFNGPIQVVVRMDDPADSHVVDTVSAVLVAEPGVAAVTTPVFNAAGDTAVLTVNPTTGPQDEATDELIHRLRDDVLPATTAGTDAEVLLTGRAMSTDLSERLSSRLPIFIVAVVAMSFVLLMIVFRSVLVAVKAAVMNLLSIAAAYGVIVAVFQWGWGKGLIGLEHTIPINPFLPLMMFAILFGLSMDYEVFLLSRVREEYAATGDNHRAVVRGLSSSARVITSAALIMMSVFGAFVLGDDIDGKMFGVGLAVAVFLDATVVRMILVPATMSLAGRANWWLPRWLDRILPHVDLEGGHRATPARDVEPEGELTAA